MKWYHWVCACEKCGKEIAAEDTHELSFRRADWKYDDKTKSWICDKCAAEAEEEGKR